MNFILEQTEEAAANEFRKKHGKDKCKPMKRSLFRKLLHKYLNARYEYPSYSFHYEFYPNSIGVVSYIVCNCCGERKDITDINYW